MVTQSGFSWSYCNYLLPYKSSFMYSVMSSALLMSKLKTQTHYNTMFMYTYRKAQPALKCLLHYWWYEQSISACLCQQAPESHPGYKCRARMQTEDVFSFYILPFSQLNRVRQLSAKHQCKRKKPCELVLMSALIVGSFSELATHTVPLLSPQKTLCRLSLRRCKASKKGDFCANHQAFQCRTHVR